jgi:hypothetical protein
MRWGPSGNYAYEEDGSPIGMIPTNVKLNGANIFGPAGLSHLLKFGIQEAKFIGVEKEENSNNRYHLKGVASGADLAPFTLDSLVSSTLYPIDVWIEAGTFNFGLMKVAEAGDSSWRLSLFDINKPLQSKWFY